MKILKLSSYFYPEQVASSHLSKDLNEGFLEADFCTENYVPMPTRGVSDEVRKEYKKRKYEVMEDGKVIVHRFSMFREGKNPIQRALRYVLVNFVQYCKGSRAKNVDLVYSASTPPTQGMLCSLVKKRLKVPFVYNLQDIFPDSLINAKMTKKGSLIWKIGRKIENFTYRNADRIIVISEDFKRNIMEKGVPEEKIVVVPNWVNTEKVYAVKREENVLFQRYQLDTSLFYLCYSGNIGHSQNMEMLLEAAGILAAELPDVRIVLIGEGAAKEEVETKIHAENLRNVIVLPFQPYEEISHVFSLGDAGLIISKPGIGGSSVPSKTWSIMAAERPVLASFDGDSQLSNLIRETGCGITAEAGDVNAFVDAVRTLYNDREAARIMGQTGRKYLKTNLDKDTCVGAYINTIKEVVEKNGGKA